MKSVAVLDSAKMPQYPVHPAVARQMLRDGQAAVYRKHPFAIIRRPIRAERRRSRRAHLPPPGQLSLFNPAPAPDLPLRLKIDPGSRVTGLAVVDDRRGEIICAGELHHRGIAIKKAIEKRKALRRGRRNRKTPYRPARFQNRRRGDCTACGGNPQSRHTLCRRCQQAGPAYLKDLRAQLVVDPWRRTRRLPPSLRSRVYNIETWVRRLCAAFPIGSISVEVARFDTQLMQNPEISGVEYQRGTLAGYEVREYLLEKSGRKCAYCHKTGVPLEMEHILPKSRGGTDRVSNLTMACRPCNQRKGSRTAAEFGHPAVERHAKAPLKDAAMMNATRYAIRDMLEQFGLPVETGTGGRTKFNRTRAGLGKSHWADAACVGASTPERWRIPAGGVVQQIKARSFGKKGRRQVVGVCRVGFPLPCGHKKCPKVGGGPKAGVRARGYQTSDIVEVVNPKGRWAGVWRGRISIRQKGSFTFAPLGNGGPTSVSPANIVRLLDRDGSYAYATFALSVGG